MAPLAHVMDIDMSPLYLYESDTIDSWVTIIDLEVRVIQLTVWPPILVVVFIMENLLLSHGTLPTRHGGLRHLCLGSRIYYVSFDVITHPFMSYCSRYTIYHPHHNLILSFLPLPILSLFHFCSQLITPYNTFNAILFHIFLQISLIPSLILHIINFGISMI